MAISNGYGRDGNRWYVNSAQSWSRDGKVEEHFREAAPNGSVPLGFIETLVDGADLVGRWAIRSYIESNWYSRRSAQTIMRNLPMQRAREIPYTTKKTVDDYLDAREAKIRAGQLQWAAHLNKNGPRVWHLYGPTDPSSGSNW